MLLRNIFILLMLWCSSACGYKILMICAPPTRSHYNLCSAVTNILAERDHDVTFITPFSADKPTKYREVLVDMKEVLDSFPSAFKLAKMAMSDMFRMMTTLTPKLTDAILKDEKVINIMNDKTEKFDLVILEFMMNQNLLGLSVKYDCPSILLTSVSLMPWVALATSNPLSLATVPNQISGFGLYMDIWQRVVNTLHQILLEVIEYFVLDPIIKDLYERDFPEEAIKVPYSELRHKIAGVYSNSHHSILGARPTLPNVAEIAGYHIEESAPLPKDLKNIMDTTKDGVILFSLGSVVKTNEMSQDFRESVIKSLSKFKQTILWKFDDEIKDLPKNIITRKWLPQASLLAHPNLKLFITHGGLLSCTEATHHGVPVLLIPVFADQTHNAKVFVDRGQGLSLKFNDITETTLTQTVKEMLTNSKYAKTAKKVSAIFHDRPIKPRDLVAYHAEHIIKTEGGSHMSPPYLPRYSHLLLDVFAIILTPIIAIALLLKCVCKKICKKFCSKSCNSQYKIKRN